jgi:hypothetical protein
MADHKNNNDTLIAVINKIRSIAIMEYDNKIYDNIHIIYEKLSGIEKRILLKGLINVCFIVEGKALVNSTDLIDVKESLLNTNTKIDATSKEIEDLNAREMIKLKTWLIKLVSIFILIFIAFSIYITYKVTGVSALSTDKAVGILEFILKEVIK